MICPKCRKISRSYVVHYDEITCEPARIDLWRHPNKGRIFLKSFKLSTKKSNGWMVPMPFCGICSGALRKRFISKEDYFMSIDENRGAKV
jgi:hypothetical protein